MQSLLTQPPLSQNKFKYTVQKSSLHKAMPSYACWNQLVRFVVGWRFEAYSFFHLWFCFTAKILCTQGLAKFIVSRMSVFILWLLNRSLGRKTKSSFCSWKKPLHAGNLRDLAGFWNMKYLWNLLRPWRNLLRLVFKTCFLRAGNYRQYLLSSMCLTTEASVINVSLRQTTLITSSRCVLSIYG